MVSGLRRAAAMRPDRWARVPVAIAPSANTSAPSPASLLTFPWVVSDRCQHGSGGQRSASESMAKEIRASGVVKAEGASGGQPDLCVDRFHARVGQPVADGGGDPGVLVGERARELDKRLEPAAARPLDPAVQQLDRLLGGQSVDLPELLLEQVGAIQPRVGALDV